MVITKKGAAPTHMENILPNLISEQNSPRLKVKFKDNSTMEFEIRLGEQMPQYFGAQSSMSRACYDDLDRIATDRKTLAFLFKDGTKFEIPLDQLPIQWGNFS